MRGQLRRYNGSNILASDPEATLISIGIEPPQYLFTGRMVSGPCPCHEDADNPSGFSYDFNKEIWSCWTHDCQEKYGRDLIGLLMGVLKIDEETAFTEAEKIIRKEKLNTEIRERSIVIPDYLSEHFNQKAYPEKILDGLSFARSYAEKRQLPFELLQRYNIGIAKKGSMKDRVVVPIRNIEGKIVGFTARKIDDSDKKVPKWFHYELKTSVNFFNAQFMKPGKDLVLTEGVWDAIKLIECGLPYNIGCVFGTSLKQGQVELIKSMSISHVIFAFDNDKAGEKGVSKSSSVLKKNLINSSVVKPTGNDWADMQPHEIKKAFNTLETLWRI